MATASSSSSSSSSAPLPTIARFKDLPGDFFNLSDPHVKAPVELVVLAVGEVQWNGVAFKKYLLCGDQDLDVGGFSVMKFHNG
jgi:hypothetical protein